MATLHVWRIAAAATVGLGAYIWRYEGSPASILFCASITLAIGAAIVLATRRILVAAVMVPAMVSVVVAASHIKLRVMNLALHAYDIVFYLSAWSTVSYLWSDYRTYVVCFALACVATVLATVWAYRIDGTRVDRRWSGGVLALAVLLTAFGAYAKGERHHTQWYWNNLVLQNFYSSWYEATETLLRGQLIEAAEVSNAPPFVLPTHCELDERPPHIILIHQESVVPPSILPGVSYDRKVDPFFQSHDGRLHRMRVETYGGASWLTEYSLLAGTSTYSFGGMRPFVQMLMRGKVSDTLPEALSRCGYRNVIFYPMLRNFVSNDKFYQSIGLKEIFDLKDQGAKTVQERDRFYYGNALNEMERHIKSSDAPMFTYIQTMAAHATYDWTYMPEVEVPGGGPGTHPEMNEYLRRLSMARIDYEYLTLELKRRFPKERVVIVHYGDHHPMATRMLLGYDVTSDAQDVVLDKESLGFITYFAVNGHNYDPPTLPQAAVVDVAYLGLIVLNAARLPLSDSFRERKRLLQLCQGRYYTCSPRGEILRFHRRLIESGLMDAR